MEDLSQTPNNRVEKLESWVSIIIFMITSVNPWQKSYTFEMLNGILGRFPIKAVEML